MTGAFPRCLQVLYYTSALVAVTIGHSFLDAQRLKTQLLNNYQKDVRPSSQTLIETEFIIFSLNNFSIERQEMSVTGVLRTSWFDPRMAWNKTEYLGISSIMLRQGKIWQPQILVMNSVKKIEILGDEQKGPLRVYSTGRVKWMIPAIINVYCEVRIIAFPFDWQTARIVFVTWGFDVSEIYMTFPGTINRDQFIDNGEWELIEITETISNITSHVEVMQGLDIKLTLRRRWAFLFITLVVPAILNSLLMAAVFKLSFESEKMSYSLTVLLTYIVLLTMVTDSLPVISTEISALQIYLTTVMCIGTVATLLTVWNVTIYCQNPEKPRPPWVISLTKNVLKPLAFGSPFCTTRQSNTRQGENGGDYKNPRKVSDEAFHPPTVAEAEKVKRISSEHTHHVNSTKTSEFSRKSSVSSSDINIDMTPAHQRRSAAKGENENSRKQGRKRDNEDGIYQQEPRLSQSNKDINAASQAITWREIAKCMDALFFRVISGCLVLETVALVVFLVIDY